MTKMIMHRTFHPVGQGAFYTEEFRSATRPQFTTIYDCGTETAAGVMDIPLGQQIQDFKYRLLNNEIDLLFISHFHEDHVKGLDELLKGTKVKRLVIPMLTEDAILATRIRNLMLYGEDARATDAIIQEIYFGNGGDGRFGEIIAVSPEIGGPEGEERGNDKMGEVYPKKRRILLSGEEIVRNKRKELRSAYKKAMKGGNDNLYTLVVESTPIEVTNQMVGLSMVIMEY